MRITTKGVERKCADCREHFPSSKLWPARHGLICDGCKSAHAAIARVR